MHQLWRRVVFNVLISNTDDHLRNHGFLYEDHRGWRLSPAYDLNPVPTDIRPRVLSTSIAAHDPAFVLHDVEGYEHREVAALLGIAVGTSKSQVHKARLRLRAILRRTS